MNLKSLLVSCVALMPTAFSAATYYVSPDGAGSKDGSTRLYTAAFDLVQFDKDKGVFTMNDPFTANLDVVAVNKYMKRDFYINKQLELESNN